MHLCQPFWALFNSCSYAICQRLQFLGRHLDMVSEIEVAWFVERHEMDVHMGHIDAHHSLADLDAGTDFLEPFGNALGEEVQFGKGGVVEVKDVVDLFLGDAEHMAADDGVDVEESQAVLGFKDLVAGNLTCDYLAENGHSG